MTALIENAWADNATGFFVRRTDDDERIFLVTNKHAILPGSDLPPEVVTVSLTDAPGGRTSIIRASVPLEGTGAAEWRGHPDGDVDVAAIDVTRLRNSYPTAIMAFIPYSSFIPSSRLEAEDVHVIDDVLIVGYPMGRLIHRDSAFPIFRAGIIASDIGEPLQDELDGRTRTLRAFLVDGGVIPGSSGSPVVQRKTYVSGEKPMRVEDYPRSGLLGIVAETQYAPVRTGVFSGSGYAGLGLVFSAETILETVDLFFA